ncbi:MAG: potassium channel family protein [Alistipes sp.]|nr:potassium channel family protein [Alistipes sp.]
MSKNTSSEPTRSGLTRTLEILKVIAGIVLLFAISWEIIAGDHIDFSQAYMVTQFVVCLVFLCDFFVRWGVAPRRSRFFWVHLPYLLISIPWLNILDWSGVVLVRDWALLVGLIPMLRAFLAMVIVVQWLVSKRNRMGRVFWAYIFTVVVFTYLSALVFYDYEAGVNTKLVGFGNALWWAWMNVTTVGAEIFAVTAIGKIVTILLPSLGMMFFPIFTTYILDRYTGHKNAE